MACRRLTAPALAGLATLLLLLLLLAAHGHVAAGDAGGCLEKGFDAPLCSTCATLAEFLPAPTDGGLVADCRACCVESTTSSSSPAAPRAVTAILEVCDSQLRRHAHIQGFLDREAKKFGPGKVKHVARWGMPPRLLLLDERGDTLETVRIDGWKTENIVEYLGARLVATEGGGGGAAAAASA